MIDGFLLGVLTTASITAGMFFLKFWRRTGDRLFLAFGTAFIIEGFSRASLLWWHPETDHGGLLFYLVRLLAFALIVAAIIGKNVESAN